MLKSQLEIQEIGHFSQNCGSKDRSAQIMYQGTAYWQYHACILKQELRSFVFLVQQIK